MVWSVKFDTYVRRAFLKIVVMYLRVENELPQMPARARAGPRTNV